MAYRDSAAVTTATSSGQHRGDHEGRGNAQTAPLSLLSDLDGLDTVLSGFVAGKSSDDRIQNQLLDEICSDIGIKDSIDLDFLDFDGNPSISSAGRFSAPGYQSTPSSNDPLCTAVANAHDLLNDTSPYHHHPHHHHPHPRHHLQPADDQPKTADSLESFAAISPASFASQTSVGSDKSNPMHSSLDTLPSQSSSLSHPYEWGTPTRERVSSTGYTGCHSPLDIHNMPSSSTFTPNKKLPLVSSSLDDTLTPGTPLNTVGETPSHKRRLRRSPSTPSLPTTTVDELIREDLVDTPTSASLRRNADELTPPDRGVERKRPRTIESGDDLLADVRAHYAYTKGADLYATPATSACPSPAPKTPPPPPAAVTPRPDSTVTTPTQLPVATVTTPTQHPVAVQQPYWQQQQNANMVPNHYQYNGVPATQYQAGAATTTTRGGAGYANLPSHYQQSYQGFEAPTPQYTQLRTPQQQQQLNYAQYGQQQTYARTRQLSYGPAAGPPPTTGPPTTSSQYHLAAPPQHQHQPPPPHIEGRTAYHQAPQSIGPSLQPLGFEPVQGASLLPDLNRRIGSCDGVNSQNSATGSTPSINQGQGLPTSTSMHNYPSNAKYNVSMQPTHMQQGFIRRIISDDNSPFRSHPLFSLLRDLIIADMNYNQPSFPLQLIANLPTDFSKLLHNYFNRNPEASAHMTALRAARERGDNSSHSVNSVMEEALQYAHKAIIEKIKARRRDGSIKAPEPTKPMSAIEAFCERFDKAVQNTVSPGPAEVQGHPSAMLPSTHNVKNASIPNMGITNIGATPLIHLPGSPRTTYQQTPHPTSLPRPRDTAKKSSGTAADSTGTGKNKVLPKESVAIMLSWLRLHQDNPYPNDDEKESLIVSTRLTMNQINYWFTNARRRILPKWAMQSVLDQQNRDKMAMRGGGGVIGGHLGAPPPSHLHASVAAQSIYRPVAPSQYAAAASGAVPPPAVSPYLTNGYSRIVR